MTGHTITRRSGEKLARLLRHNANQPPNHRRQPVLADQSQLVALYEFSLNEDMDSDPSAAGDVTNLEDSGDTDTVILQNSGGLFDGLLNNDEGLALRIGDDYWIIQPIESNVLAVFCTLDGALALGQGNTATATVVASWGSGAPSASASLTITNGGDAYGPAGARVLAMRVGATWLAVTVETYSLRFEGTASVDFDESDATVQIDNPATLSPWPYLILPVTTPGEGPPYITAQNDHNHNAVAGDVIVCTWNEDAEEWWITEVKPALAPRFHFEFQSWPTGRQQLGTSTRITPTRVAYGFSGSLPSGAEIQVRDRYDLAHNASGAVSSIAADTGVAEYNPDTGEWDIIECTHRATHCIGTLYAAFSGTPATFDVQVAQTGCLDGSHPENTTGSDQVTVQNRYSWEAGDSGGEIEIFRDPHTGNWLPRQMECPS